MIQLRQLESWCPEGAAAPRFGIGESRDGARWGWFEGAPSGASAERELPAERLLSLPRAMSLELARSALEHWPGWRLTAIAQLELGSRVLVVGSDWLALSVLRISRLRGCQWRARAPWRGVPTDAEFGVEELKGPLVRRFLPDEPDAIVLTEQGNALMVEATRLCRRRGVVVAVGSAAPALDIGFYPEVHRRGLRLVFTTSYGPFHRDRAAESADFERLSRAVGSSRHAVP